MFFVLASDIEPLLRKLESSYQVHYYKAGMFDNPKTPNYSSSIQFPNLGFALVDESIATDSYLVMPKSVEMNVREVPQRAGGIKYAVDFLVNEASVELKIAGIYEAEENVLIAGRIAILNKNEFATSFFKTFSNLMKKEFRRVDTFYVGNEAYKRLQEGWRLVINVRAPKQGDLKIK